MANHGAQRLAARARGPAVSAGAPIAEAKITAPRVPGWAVQRPRITELIAQGTRWSPLTVVTGPPRRRQDGSSGAVGGSGATRPGGLGLAG
jgi:hypothetical protein